MARIQVNQQTVGSPGIGEGMLSPSKDLVTYTSPADKLMTNVASGAQALGQQVIKYGEQQLEKQDLEDTTKAQVQFLTDLDTKYQDYITQTPFEDSESYIKNSEPIFKDTLTASVSQIRNLVTRDKFVQQMTLVKQPQYLSSVATQGRTLALNKYKAEDETSLNNSSTLIVTGNKFTSYQEELAKQIYTIKTRAQQTNTPLNSPTVQARLKEVQTTLRTAEAQYQIHTNPVVFLAKLDGNEPGWKQDLEASPELKKQITAGTITEAEAYMKSKHAPIYGDEDPSTLEKFRTAAENRIKVLDAEKKAKDKENNALISYQIADAQKTDSDQRRKNGQPTQKTYVNKKYNLDGTGTAVPQIDIKNQKSGYIDRFKKAEKEANLGFPVNRVTGSEFRAGGTTHKGLELDTSMSERTPEQRIAWTKFALGTGQFRVLGTSDKSILAAFPEEVKSGKLKDMSSWDAQHKDNHKNHIHGSFLKDNSEQIEFTSYLQEATFMSGLQTSKAQALINLDKQIKSEAADQDYFTNATQLANLHSGAELQAFRKGKNDQIAAMPEGAAKRIALTNLAILKTQIKAKESFLNSDPAAYAESLSASIRGAKGADKYAQIKAYQKNQLGLLPGQIRVLTKEEETKALNSVFQNETPTAKSEALLALQAKYGEANYAEVISQLANKTNSLDAAYFAIPQLKKLSESQAVTDLLAGLAYKPDELNSKLKGMGLNFDKTYSPSLKKALEPLTKGNFDNKAVAALTIAAEVMLKNKLLNATDKNVDRTVKTVVDSMLHKQYNLVDFRSSGLNTYSTKPQSILISKVDSAGKPTNYNVNNITTFLSAYIDTNLRQGDYLAMPTNTDEKSLSFAADKKYAETHHKNFTSILEQNMYFRSDIAGKGVYVFYASPVANTELPVLNAKGNIIYIDYADAGKYGEKINSQLNNSRTEKQTSGAINRNSFGAPDTAGLDVRAIGQPIINEYRSR